MVELLGTKTSRRNFNHFVKGILAHTLHHCWKNALIDGRETVSKEWWNVPVELLTTMSVSWDHHHGNSGRKASEGVRRVLDVLTDGSGHEHLEAKLEPLSRQAPRLTAAKQAERNALLKLRPPTSTRKTE